MTIKNLLDCLKNHKLSKIGRASTMVWIQFGELKKVKSHEGSFKEIGKYALHIQCPWRIESPEGKIIIGSGDIFIPKDKNTADDNFIQKTGNTRFDVLAKEINGEAIVSGIEADETGSIIITFQNSWELLIFIETSYIDEYYESWRFFEPDTDNDHFVV